MDCLYRRNGFVGQRHSHTVDVGAQLGQRGGADDRRGHERPTVDISEREAT